MIGTSGMRGHRRTSISTWRKVRGAIFVIAVALAMVSCVKPPHPPALDHSAPSFGVQNAVILLIRHAEKPASGKGLSSEGEEHAQTYVPLFSDYQIGARHLKVEALFAAADSPESARPRLTLTPLSQSLKLPINTSFLAKNYDGLAHHLLTSEFSGKTVVVCWKHGEMMHLAAALGVEAAALPSAAHWPSSWPDNQFGWVLQISYDDSGKIDVTNTCCITPPARRARRK